MVVYGHIICAGGGLKSIKEHLEGCPAGQPTHAEGLQPEGVLVQSPRDQRVLDWLVEQVGLCAVVEACSRLPGRRRPYPSNVAKVLGLTPPAELALAADEDVQRRLAACKVILKGGS